jgi:hypothetical protein
MIIGLLRDSTMARYCSGLDYRGWMMPADTFVAARHDGKSLISVAGALTNLATQKMVHEIWRESRRPGTRLIFVDFWSSCGELTGMASAADVLSCIPESVGLVAYLGCACGPALWFAMQFPLAFAKPTAKIGHIGCGTDSGDFDIELSEVMAAELSIMRPAVELRTWARLYRSELNGEQAEASGIVGGLRRDVFELSGLDPNGALVQ